MPDKKVKVTASIDVDLVEWIDQEVGKRRFASRTHALEFATAKLKGEFQALSAR